MEKNYRHGGERSRCLECGNELGYGRSDRKFCCAQCRYDYHNMRTRPVRASRGMVTKAVERNYSILSGLFRDGVRKVSRAQLQDMGFDFSHVTTVTYLGKGIELGIYDIRFRQMEKGIVGIRKESLSLPQCRKKASDREKKPTENDND